MYRWRHLTDTQRVELLNERKSHCRPWHSPPHRSCETNAYLITAACFEHRPIIGNSVVRIAEFEQSLQTFCNRFCDDLYAWTVLPNHYHMLVKAKDVRHMLRQLGQLHGRTSFQWNGEDQKRGRTTWFGAAETGIKSERHFWASLLYVLNNAVKHGYVDHWQDWPFCNAVSVLETIGRDKMKLMWREYPLDQFGADWDPPEL